ncbi:hypothetical protein MYX76_09500 [Desulfobacterota bacterium AH_259_B03_O07]|nr:hypothetical protein [Desulfobacterota bacterium AH_259_B03_O07]
MTKSHTSKRGGLIIRDASKAKKKAEELATLEPREVEILSESETDLAHIRDKIKEVEEELIPAIKKSPDFWDKLTGRQSPKRRAEDLKVALDIVETYRKINSELTLVGTQMYTRREALLDAQISYFKKNAKAQKAVQVMINEMEIQDLRMQKLQKDFAEFELKQKLARIKDPSRAQEGDDFSIVDLDAFLAEDDQGDDT